MGESKQKIQKPKLWTLLFVLIVAMTLCCFITGQGLNSATSVYLVKRGGSTTYAGFLAGIFSVAAAVCRIVCGPIVDFSGRVRVMLMGTIILICGTLLPVFLSSTLAFVIARFLQGAGFATATTASATAAADVLPFERLGEGISYYGLGQAIAMSVGPAFALFLVGTDPAENLFIGLSCTAALAFLFTLFCGYERNPSRLPETSTYRMKNASQAISQKTFPSLSVSMFFEPRALPGMLPMLILSPAFGFGIFFVGLYGTELGFSNVGLFYTISAISMIISRLKSGPLMDKALPIRIFAASVLCGVFAYLMLLGAGAGIFGNLSKIVYYLAGFFYGLCLGISLPLNQSVAVKNTPQERWGAANALYLLASDVGIGIGSMIWGFTNDALGFEVTICFVMACILASYLLAWIVYPQECKKAS